MDKELRTSENNMGFSGEEDKYKLLCSLSSEGIWKAGFPNGEGPGIHLSPGEQLQYFSEKAVLEECNEAMARMYGYDSPKDLLGKKPEDLPVVFNDAHLDAVKAFFASGGRLSGFATSERSSLGEMKYFANNIGATVKETRFTGIYGVKQDVTANRLADKAVVQLKTGLTEKERMLAEAAASMDLFIYTVTHDVSAPVSNIEGLVNVLKLNECSQKEDAKMLIDLMDVAIDKYKTTIRNLAETAKAKVKKGMAKREENCAEVFDQVLTAFRGAIEETGAVVRAAFEEQQVPVAGRELFSLLYHLLDNALAYRHPSRPPEIDVTSTRSGNHYILRVKDNGIGLSQSDMGRIFELFRTAQTSKEGYGIGLYLVRKIVEQAGGKIEVESTVGQGTTFSLLFESK